MAFLPAEYSYFSSRAIIIIVTYYYYYYVKIFSHLKNKQILKFMGSKSWSTNMCIDIPIPAPGSFTYLEMIETDS